MNQITRLAAIGLVVFFALVTRISAEEFGGIGLNFFTVTTFGLDEQGNVQNERHMYYVDSTTPGTPAAETDLGLGGQIVEVDGKEVDSTNPDAVRDAIRGPVGKPVMIKIFRQTWDKNAPIPSVNLEYKEYTLTRVAIIVSDGEK